jgi:hypothetical protein
MTLGRDVAGTEEGSGKTAVRERGGMALGSEVVGWQWGGMWYGAWKGCGWHSEGHWKMWMALGGTLEKGVDIGYCMWNGMVH